MVVDYLSYYHIAMLCYIMETYLFQMMNEEGATMWLTENDGKAPWRHRGGDNVPLFFTE